jgi:hypothetical protein
LDGLVAGQDVFDHEPITVFEEPKIGEKPPHCHARRGEDGQTDGCGDLASKSMRSEPEGRAASRRAVHPSSSRILLLRCRLPFDLRRH